MLRIASLDGERGVFVESFIQLWGVCFLFKYGTFGQNLKYGCSNIDYHEKIKLRRENKLNNIKKKTLLSTTLILLLTISVFSAGISLTKAVPNVQVNTYAFIATNPNPIGINQPLQVSMWLSDPPPTAAGIGGDRWIGFKVYITRPDGTTETKGPYTSDAVGGAYFTYYPTQTGNYTFQMKYPGGQTIVASLFDFGSFTFKTINNTYLASDSNIMQLTVQIDPIVNPAQTPLPTSYWTRPISGLNLQWSQVSGNWLMAAWNYTGRGFDSGPAFVGEGTTPNSAHILWTKPITFGGLVGGNNGVTSFTDGRSYEYFFKPPVIISGRLYYNTIAAEEPRTIGDVGNLGIICVDMATGQTLFTIPNQTLAMGQIYTYNSPNQAGALAYLWTNNWRMYDAWTGNYILSLTGVPSGTTTIGSDGSIIIYSMSAYSAVNQTFVLSMWNSSKAIPPAGDVGVAGSSNAWQWRPYLYAGYTINATGTTNLPNADMGNAVVPRNTNGYQWQVLAQNVSGQSFSSFTGNVYMDGNNLVAVVINATDPLGKGSRFIEYSLKDGSFQGSALMNIPTDIPAAESLTTIASFQNYGEYAGVFYEFIKATMQYVAYDVKTGNVKWVSEPFTNPWGMYVPSFLGANGLFYSAEYDGVIHAYDAATGTQLWQYSQGSSGFQTPYGVWPFYSGLTGTADGKIIGTSSEHGNGVEPLYSGERIYVIDAITGANIWNMTGWFEQMAIADGKLLSHNCYDNQIYCFGKGPSAVTVETPLSAVTQGSNIIIQGTVTDQSPGAKGTPAISDADMSEWMPYLYEQQSIPTHANGVPVKLQAIDPNGNTIELGTVTSDVSGNYALMWAPEHPGLYTVIATFEGSESYYGSYAVTHVASNAAAAGTVTPTPVVVTPTPTPTTTPTATPVVTPSPVPSGAGVNGIGAEVYIAIAAVVIIVAIGAAAVVLRRRK